MATPLFLRKTALFWTQSTGAPNSKQQTPQPAKSSDLIDRYYYILSTEPRQPGKIESLAIRELRGYHLRS